MKLSISLAALLAGTVACFHRAPQVLTPVRIDTTPVSAEPVATAPAAAVDSEGSTRAGMLADDPFARIDRMDWPGPNAFRAADGSPGPDYWQQRADYTIAATLDTTSRTIRGAVTIRYTNNSPDTLRFVWLQLDQNLYRPGSKGSALFTAESRWGVRGFQGGYDLSEVRVNGHAARIHVDDTMGRIDLDTPLPARGGTATIEMNYSFRVPEHGSDRMGRDSTLYEIAQWYPRMAVYDDLRGWNTDPYLGQGEFYLEYGDIEYAVTVPAGYIIAGTGVLQNPAEVLTTTQRARLERAATATRPLAIITRAEADSARHRAVPGTRTWRFRAQNVRDVAWAGAPDFRWDAVSTGPIAGNPAPRGVLCQSFYQFPKAGTAWESGAEMCQWTIRLYSTLWMGYPYPQASGVAGPVGGMEYPMFVMVSYGTNDPASIFSTLDHELGHEWYPMVVGSNERRYAWQDEGFNTYQNAFSNERRYPGTSAFPGYMRNWRQSVDARTQAPLMTRPDRIEASALGAIGYRKPGAVLLALRDNVIGREVMDRAMREYARRWTFKHPTPGDFFRTVESVSGEDLSWFWNSFFYGQDVLDIAIDSVTPRQEGGQHVVDIALRRVTSVPFPVAIRLKLADGSTQDVSLPVQIWWTRTASQTERSRYTATIPVRGTVTGARLWPDPDVPDWNASNDTWGDAPPADSNASSTSGGLTPPIGTRATSTSGGADRRR